MNRLQIDLTQSMCLTAQLSIDLQQQDLQKILPIAVAATSLSPNYHNQHLKEHHVFNNNSKGNTVKQSQSHRETQRETETETEKGTGLELLLFPVLRLSVLGQGASSTVYESIRLTDLSLCAEKSLVVGDAHKRQQMVREIELLRSLCDGDDDEPFSHRHRQRQSHGSSYIVQLYGILPNPTDGTLSILLEYMDMGSLQQLVAGGGCRDEVILASLAFQITSGLAFLHKRRLVHRDIKPSNILLSSSGIVKLSDFGIAKSMEVGASLAESFIGTFEYMSPERLSGEPYSFVSDIWSVGISLHAVAIGRYPFSSKGDFWEILQAAQQSSQLLPPCSMFGQQFIAFIAASTDLHTKKRPTAENLLLHPFLRCATSSLSKSQIEELRSIMRLKSLDRASDVVLRSSMMAGNDIITVIVQNWKRMVHALYFNDNLDEIVSNFEEFKSITVTKEMINQLATGLHISEGRLKKAFRKALQETRTFIGDRFRFLQDNPPLKSSPLEDSRLEQQQKSEYDFRPQSVPSIASECKFVTQLRHSEDCLVNLSSSINQSLKSILRSEAKEESQYDDDFHYESEDKYTDDYYDEDEYQDQDDHIYHEDFHQQDTNNDCRQSYNSDFEN